MDISINNYSCPDALRLLCTQLDMPSEVTERLVEHIIKLDLGRFDSHFNKLFSMDTADEAIKQITELCKTEEDPSGDAGLKGLTIYLAAAQHTHDIYKNLGIDDIIFIDTIKAFTRFVREHKDSFDHYGFDRQWWTCRQLSAKLFRLGVLEFEIWELSKDAEPMGPFEPGTPMLSVHIPSDSVMTREALDESYRMAGEFFPKYFPEYNYKGFRCSSWLLSPTLKKVLKPGSRILDFQSDYEITYVDPENNFGMIWIYKKKYDDYNELPEDTSLRRDIKKLLLAGEKIGSASGYVRDFRR